MAALPALQVVAASAWDRGSVRTASWPHAVLRPPPPPLRETPSRGRPRLYWGRVRGRPAGFLHPVFLRADGRDALLQHCGCGRCIAMDDHHWHRPGIHSSGKCAPASPVDDAQLRGRDRFSEVRVIGGVTGREKLGPSAIETIVWSCLAFSVLAADIVLQWQDLTR